MGFWVLSILEGQTDHPFLDKKLDTLVTNDKEDQERLTEKEVGVPKRVYERESEVDL